MSDIDINEAELNILTNLGLADGSMRIPEYQDVFAAYESLGRRLKYNRKELDRLSESSKSTEVKTTLKDTAIAFFVTLAFGYTIFNPSLMEPVVVSASFISLMWLLTLLSRLSTERRAKALLVRESDIIKQNIDKYEAEVAVVTKILNSFSFRLNPDHAEIESKS